MILTSAFMLMATVFALALFMLVMVCSNRFSLNISKNSSFECGFDPMNSARLPFSMRFFLLAVLFLIFDVEIALFFPTLVGLSLGLQAISYLSIYGFIFIMLMGLLYEWSQGSLSWVICVG